MALFSVFLAYLAVFTLGAAFLIISVVMGWGSDILHHDFGFGHDVHVDGGVHGETQDVQGANILSPLLLAVFSTFFGATGMLLTYFTESGVLVNLGISLLVSIPLYLLLYRGMARFYSSHEGSSSTRERDAVGTIATVTVPITPGSVGAITYNAGDRHATASARADVAIAVGEQVVITELEGSIAKVTKRS